ncbi:capsule assembly Wzi family protein [Occallatibacter savannae]|uniref:capsule assembly Wzi family protein n=1 Tax=Occallatibacter savannae TaxID=1002691 RepID=UPI001EF500C5|nr:capsule assembly Wzi family protein [Occallatibacter savannae]
MSVSSRGVLAAVFSAVFSIGILVSSPFSHEASAQALPDTSRPIPVCEPATLDSPYIPVDSWIYPAVMRLYGLGYLDTVYLGMRPWTRSSIEGMLEEVSARISDAEDYGDATSSEAQQIYDAVDRELHPDMSGPCGVFQGHVRIESAYSAVRAISGTPLHDSFHLGSSIINDYGRPFENGINNYTGLSGYASAGRFLVYARGEFQGAPSAAGYSSGLAQVLSAVDGIPTDPNTLRIYPQATIPQGPIGTTTRARFLEAYVSTRFLNHEISLGKQDDWLGPGLGGGFAFSNNAENFYSFRINRVEPLHVPGLSYITGPFRYEFVVGGLHGHTYVPNPAYPGPGQPNVITPGNPWMHIEKISFRPTENLEFGFERSAIWGGKGHGPITLHTFLKSFFSLASPTNGDKLGRNDPGARFGSFDFSYRLPYMRHWLTLYADGEVHDDVSPIDAPRRASWRPGFYLSHLPGIPKLDLRAEGVYTDPPIRTSNGGRFMYWEYLQKNGYTNNGQMMGDWVGREGKGGQAWITWHLSGDESIQVSVRHHKVAKDFIPGSTTEIDPTTGTYIQGGTTLNDVSFQAVKRLRSDLEINGNFTYEHWKAPIYLPGQQTVTTTTIKLTWFPQRKISF